MGSPSILGLTHTSSELGASSDGCTASDEQVSAFSNSLLLTCTRSPEALFLFCGRYFETFEAACMVSGSVARKCGGGPSTFCSFAEVVPLLRV